MKDPESTWNPDEWLNRCAWCTRAIRADREVFAIKARLSPNSAQLFPPGSIQPLPLPRAHKAVPVISPGENSQARREGVQAVFQVCSRKCGEALLEALQQERSISHIELVHPGQTEGRPPPSLLPDFRQSRAAMEKMMRQLTRLLEQQNFKSEEEVNEYLDQVLAGGLDAAVLQEADLTALDEAQDLVQEAWELPTRKRRIAMAKRALEISPDCAEAYLLLAHEASTPKQEVSLYQQAVEAAERALGSEAFERFAGHFWGVIETRPYMRARASLAQCLWEQGDRDAAIDHYQALLDLNPNDNQGNRYVLLDWLLAEGRDEEAGKLLVRYPDDAMATWAYDRALWLFRRDGPSRGAKKALRQALKHNPFVPSFLLGEKSLPRTAPSLVGIGDEAEAVDYAHGALDNWQNTPYALDWLRENALAIGIVRPDF